MVTTLQFLCYFIEEHGQDAISLLLSLTIHGSVTSYLVKLADTFVLKLLYDY